MSRHHPVVSIWDLDFADDIASLAKDIHKTQELLKGVQHESAKMRVQANGKKTKIMAYSQELLTNIISKSGKTFRSSQQLQVPWLLDGSM